MKKSLTEQSIKERDLRSFENKSDIQSESKKFDDSSISYCDCKV